MPVIIASFTPSGKPPPYYSDALKKFLGTPPSTLKERAVQVFYEVLPYLTAGNDARKVYHIYTDETLTPKEKFDKLVNLVASTVDSRASPIVNDEEFFRIAVGLLPKGELARITVITAPPPPPPIKPYLDPPGDKVNLIIARRG